MQNYVETDIYTGLGIDENNKNQLDGQNKKLILFLMVKKLISQEKYLNHKFILLQRLLVILQQHQVKVIQMEFL